MLEPKYDSGMIDANINAEHSASSKDDNSLSELLLLHIHANPPF